MKNNKIIPVFVPHKGCPNDCVFCNQKKITGKTNIVVNKDYVISIVEEYIKSRNKYADLAFFGGSFTAIDESLQIELLETAYYYKQKGYFDNIRISTRPDCINEHILNIQNKYGVNIIELGIQSLDDDVLVKANRGHTVKDSINASELIKQYKCFTLGHQIMPGLPGSNIEKDILTCRKSIKIKPDIVRIYPTLTIKETELENLYKENKYTPLKLSEAVKLCSNIYSLYTVNNIKVIRIGLQNTDKINDKNDVVAGPYHPAFRQLVEENLFLNAIIFNLSKRNINLIDSMELQANKKLMSYISGHKRNNIIELKNKFSINKLRLKEISDENNINIICDNSMTCTINTLDIFGDYINNN